MGILGISIFRLIAIWHGDYIRRFDSSHNVIYENFAAFPASFFLDLLQSDSDNEAELAQECLIKLLPKLTEEDAPSFTTGYRSRLYALLTYSNVDLVLAVLQSLPHLGDREAIIFVRSLSQGK